MRLKSIERLLIITAATCLTVVAGMYFLQNSNDLKIKFFNLTTVALVATLVTVVINLLAIVRKNPSLFTISVIGYPGTGKTVYITVLFDLLQRTGSRSNKDNNNTSSVMFAPYGSETVERVTSNLNLLSRNHWPPRTAIDEVFHFRGLVTLKPKILPISERFKLEVADFAGEKFDELNPAGDNWLHKSNYFQNVVNSDAIFFALDASVLLDPSGDYKILENSFIAALQVLAEKKGVEENYKMSAPIALLVLKSDILQMPEDDMEQLLRIKFGRFLGVCNNRCLNFMYFFVSSVGYVKNSLPPDDLEPVNVVKPLNWVFSKT